VGLLDTYPNLYLDTTMVLCDFFEVTVDPLHLSRHADRILYGTDYPHIPHDMETEVRGLLAMDLGEEPTRKILHDTAAGLFPIRPVSSPVSA
jgi:predicted TIM-barrel fold metal-dependent hydrolase